MSQAIYAAKKKHGHGMCITGVPTEVESPEYLHSTHCCMSIHGRATLMTGVPTEAESRVTFT